MKKYSVLRVVGLCFVFGLCFLRLSAIDTIYQKTLTDTFVALLPTNPNVDENGIYFKFKSDGFVAKVSYNGSEKYLLRSDDKFYINEKIDRKGKLFFWENDRGYQLFHISQNKDNTFRVKRIPLWMSILPPLLAIILALIFKEVIISLFSGIWLGSFIVGGMRLDSLYYMVQSLFDVVKHYIIESLYSVGHLSVIVFSVLIGGIVAIISKNGGMKGVVLSLSRYARTPVSAQFVTWLLGVAIFFDDYANTLIVGNTMRSVTDKFKVSREKLAYIVDSTAAPVSSIAFITTWIGAELGYIDDGLQKLSLFGDYTPYSVFLSSLKYSFYPILTIIFILFIIFLKKDYGPMLAAEKNSRALRRADQSTLIYDSGVANDEHNEFAPVEDAPMKWYHAVVPVLSVVVVTIYGLIDTGMSNLGKSWAQLEGGFFRKLGDVIGASDSYIALLWSSLTGVIIALIMTRYSRIMKLTESISVMLTGFKAMLPALIILILAWALAITTEQLHTAEYLSSLLTGNIHPYSISVLIFLISAIISFSTGSSWSTMAILYPIAIPATYSVCLAEGFDHELAMNVLYAVIATVLSASVFGDHCSPISDTTILSSLSSGCNHIEHVRTQIPYALTVGIFSVFSLYVSVVMGGKSLVITSMYVFSLVCFYIIISRFGKRVD